MLDTAITTQLRSHFAKIVHPVRLVAALDDSATSAELRGLLDELAALSEQIAVTADGSTDAATGTCSRR